MRTRLARPLAVLLLAFAAAESPARCETPSDAGHDDPVSAGADAVRALTPNDAAFASPESLFHGDPPMLFAANVAEAGSADGSKTSSRFQLISFETGEQPKGAVIVAGGAASKKPKPAPSTLAQSNRADDSPRTDGDASESGEPSATKATPKTSEEPPPGEGEAAVDQPAEASPAEPLTPAPAVDPATVDVAGLTQRVAASMLDDAAKQSLTEKVGAIDGLLSTLKTAREERADFDAKSKSLGEQIESLKRAIAEFESAPLVTPHDGATLAELEVAVAAAEQQRVSASQILQTVRTAIEERRRTLDELQVSLPAMATAVKTLAAAAPSGEPGLTGEIDRLLLRLKEASAKAKLERAQAQQRYLTAAAATELDALEKRQAADQVAAAERVLAAVRPQIDRLKKAELERTARETRAASNAAPEPLRPIATENESYIAEMRRMNEAREAFERELKRVTAERDAFDAMRTEYEDDLQSSSLSELKGLRLRVEVERLPDLARLRSQRNQNLQIIRDLQRRQFELESERQRLDSPEAAATERIASSDGALAPFRAELVELLAARRDLLQQLKDLAADSESQLSRVDQIDAQLIESVAEFGDQAEAAVLWVRSNPPIWETDWELSPRAKSLLRPKSYVEQSGLLIDDMRGSPAVYLLAGSAVFLLLIVRSRVWKNCRPAIEAARRKNNISLRPFVRILLANGAMAAFWPIVIAFVGWRITEVGGDETTVSLGSGILRLALLFFTLEFIRVACRQDGLAETLDIPTAVTRYVRRKVRWLEWAALPLAAGILVLHDTDVGQGHQLAERLCFAASMAVLAAFFHKLLRTNSAVVQWSRTEGGLLGRYRPLYYLTAVGLPTLFGVLSLGGYHFAGLRLAEKLQQTLWIGLAVLVARLLLTRLVNLHRRRMAIAAMHERSRLREEMPDGAPQPGKDAEPTADIGEMSEQLRRLIATVLTVAMLFGLYLIWVDVLPSLSRLANFELYSVARTATELDPSTTRSIGPVDLAVGALIGVIAFTASRNLPGLLEFTVLDRMGLDRSVRYAITTICSYIIAIVGLVVAGKAAGFAWQNVQWLAAGLTVGLGFGLQEIFANFISGLIIFIEQPVRVGDIVTLGDVTGSVTRIRIRATTITNWDRKEYIVPNREFITGRLLNWTLSDQTNRVVVNVGVAYGSDVKVVRQMILDAAESHPEVMDDPGPVVTFEGFGDSSLNFVLRCYLPTLENRLATTHDLHEAINDRFRDGGIEIPFPQRDLNIRNVPEDQVAKLAETFDDVA